MKTIIFTDIHFGYKANSKIFNQDCLDFINWFVIKAKENNIDTCYMLGDYNHNRANINISTLKYAYEGLKILSENFKNVFLIVGNHDSHYKDSIDTHSLVFSEHMNNITIVDKPTINGKHLLVPWIVDKNQWKDFSSYDKKYLFGHFELPNFILTAGHIMPDNGFDYNYIENFDYIFSGHFHKRQQKKIHGANVIYCGNSFPHNFADKNDIERGAMIFDDDINKITFINWEDCPNYKTGNLSEFLEKPENYITDKTYAKVIIDIEVDFDEASFIRETFQKHFGIRELSLINHDIEQLDIDISNILFQSIDDIVNASLDEIQSNTIDKILLKDLYQLL